MVVIAADWFFAVGDVALVASMVLLGLKPKTPCSAWGPYGGWVCSLSGNAIFIMPIYAMHRPFLLVPPVVFTALAFWNVCKLLRTNS
jgi:hypothetical protein